MSREWVGPRRDPSCLGNSDVQRSVNRLSEQLTSLETLAPLSQPSGHEILLPIHFAIPQQAASTCLMLVSASKQLPYELAQSAACSRSYLILPSVRPTSAASKAPLRAKDANCGITTPPLASPSRRLTTSALLKEKKKSNLPF